MTKIIKRDSFIHPSVIVLKCTGHCYGYGFKPEMKTVYRAVKQKREITRND